MKVFFLCYSHVSCFLMIYSKMSWISDTEHDLLGNSNFLFLACNCVFKIIAVVWVIAVVCCMSMIIW